MRNMVLVVATYISAVSQREFCLPFYLDVPGDVSVADMVDGLEEAGYFDLPGAEFDSAMWGPGSRAYMAHHLPQRVLAS